MFPMIHGRKGGREGAGKEAGGQSEHPMTTNGPAAPSLLTLASVECVKDQEWQMKRTKIRGAGAAIPHLSPGWPQGPRRPTTHPERVGRIASL